MKPKHLYLSLILLILTFSGLFGTAAAADVQKVHALLICLGDDLKIRASVNVNEENMTDILLQVSENCNVDLTIMKSVKVGRGVVSKMTLSNATTLNPIDQKQGLITTRQVIDWLENLNPNEEDTVLVYYNGHGGVYGETHMLHFDGVKDLYNRNELSALLARKQARLKILITDTCKNQLDTPLPQANAYYAQVQEKNRSYTKHLFLQHSGMLDITAASTNQFALANNQLGGFFTAALIESFNEKSDMKGEGGIGNSDGFLSWEEVFAKCVWETQDLFSQSTSKFGAVLSSKLGERNQTTQTPEQFSLPSRSGGNSGSVTPGPTTDPPKLTDSFPNDSDGSVPSQHFNTMITWEKDGATMAHIPAGEFRMGVPTRKNARAPAYSIYVDAFYMDTHEVTLAQYEEFLKRTGHRPLPEETYADAPAPNYPVVNVTWDDAVAYAKWAGKRLPTEAEWEKAARGGFVGQKYPWGNNPPDGTQANLAGKDEYAKTAPVGRHLPNEYGLHDMLGNVWEWCADTNDPNNRVLRGNSWRELPRTAWLTERYLIRYPRRDLVGGAVGFRCVVDADEVQR